MLVGGSIGPPRPVPGPLWAPGGPQEGPEARCQAKGCRHLAKLPSWFFRTPPQSSGTAARRGLQEVGPERFPRRRGPFEASKVSLPPPQAFGPLLQDGLEGAQGCSGREGGDARIRGRRDEVSRLVVHSVLFGRRRWVVRSPPHPPHHHPSSSPSSSASSTSSSAAGLAVGNWIPSVTLFGPPRVRWPPSIVKSRVGVCNWLTM